MEGPQDLMEPHGTSWNLALGSRDTIELHGTSWKEIILQESPWNLVEYSINITN